MVGWMKTGLLGAAFVIFSGSMMMPVSAEAQKFEADGYYTMEEDLKEDPVIAQERAKVDARYAVNERARLFLAALPDMRERSIPLEELRFLSSGILRVQEDPIYAEPLEGQRAVRYRCHMTAFMEPADIAGEMGKDRKTLIGSVRRHRLLWEQLDNSNLEISAIKSIYRHGGNEAERAEAVKQNEQGFAALDWIRQGTEAYARKDIAGALLALRQAEELNPPAWETWDILGRVYGEMGYFLKAMECCRKSMEKNPEAYETLLAMGKAHADMEEFPEAIEFFQKALAVNPAGKEANLCLGLCFMKQKESGQAGEYLQKYLALDSQDELGAREEAEGMMSDMRSERMDRNSGNE